MAADGRRLFFAEVADLVLEAVAAVAATEPNPVDPFRGLYVSDDAALALAREPGPEHAGDRLAAAAELLGLDDRDTALLALCAAPELDARLGRLFGFLHDDLTRRLASPRLAARLLADGEAGRLDVLARLAAGGRLRRTGAVELVEEDSGIAVADRLLKIDPSLAGHLLGAQLQPADPAERLVAPADDPGRPATLAELCGLTGPDAIPVLAVGADAPELLAAALGRPVLVVSGRHAAAQDAAAAAWLRAALAGAAPCFAVDELDPVHREAAGAVLGQLAGPVLLWARSSAGLPLGDLSVMVVSVPPLTFAERVTAWRRVLPDTDVDGVAARFRLGLGQISRAADIARASARREARSTLASGDLERGAREASRTALGTLATRVEPRYGWDDLVLPSRQLEQLRQIDARLRHRDLVLSGWGFERVAGRAEGLKILFAGPSGTGKSMASSVLAAGLGLDLFRIDLAGLVSKYVGETEQNLDRLFAAAHDANAVLLFDEADALFGKRSEVKDAHDRYANIEVAYLLQRMEDHPGAVVLATNLRSNMDDAFLRRLDVVVDFPLPTVDDRERLWRHMLPDEAPVDGDVDVAELAKLFEVTGGSIRNCTITAAFLAAADGGTIAMAHVVQAVALEYRKNGRLTLEADFAHLHAHVDGGRAEPVGADASSP
ncbi:MAG TPA: ATP-binding protein [Solirubrobacteraceae bacterium]|nr:ATP-binding protein [Solirubrobacteraceae bacterium]